MISPLISLMTALLFSQSSLISTYLWIVLFFSFDWFLVSYYFGQRRHLILFSNSWFYLRFVLWTNRYSSSRIFYMSLKRMCILLLLNKMFCSFLVAHMVKTLLTMWEAQVWSLGQEDTSGEGNSNPFQYSYLENSMDREAWQTTVHWVAKSWTWLSD